MDFSCFLFIQKIEYVINNSNSVTIQWLFQDCQKSKPSYFVISLFCKSFSKCLNFKLFEKDSVLIQSLSQYISYFFKMMKRYQSRLLCIKLYKSFIECPKIREIIVFSQSKFDMINEPIYLGIKLNTEESHIQRFYEQVVLIIIQKINYYYHYFEIMSQTQLISQLKFRITSLESQLIDKNKEIEQYKTIQSEADNKIKALNKIQAQKVKLLLNSIQILKKEKASIQGLSKQHKRSKLIEQLNKQIADQDLALEVLRKYIYEQEGKEKGRSICDQIIVKALTKGPQRIRPLSRQQLKMEIDKLKSINISLEGKLKNGNKKSGDTKNRNNNDDLSQISSEVSDEQSFMNPNQMLLSKLKDLQFDNENMKLEINSKVRIIQKLKNELKDNEKMKTEIEIYKNQIEITNRKLNTLQKLMKQSKQNTNNKIIQLYEREIKVQELQIVSKQNSDKLKQAHQSHNILIDEIQLEKQKLQVELQKLKKQNEQIILQNITNKKRQDQQKTKINQIRDISSKQKDQLQTKLQQYKNQIQTIVEENSRYLAAYRKIQADLFSERAKWVQDKAEMIQQLQKMKQNKAQTEVIGKYLQDIDILSRQNKQLKDILQAGGTGTGSDDHILMARLQNYKRKVQHLEKIKDKSSKQLLTEEAKYYDDMFKKYNQLADQFEQYKKQNGQKSSKKHRPKQIVQINRKEQNLYDNMTSGISSLNLGDVDSDILDNFDTSYEYEIQINEDGRKVKVPRVTQADKELLKLLSSDLWYFVQNQQQELGQKIDQALSLCESEDFEQNYETQEKIKQLKNLNHPRGKQIFLYEQQLDQLDKMSERVSVTSGLDKQLDKYDSDINIKMQKLPFNIPKAVNMRNINKVTLSSGSQVSMSGKSGESNIMKKKKVNQKATTIGVKNTKLDKISSDVQSVDSAKLINSDVSSYNYSQSQLQKINSDVEMDFKKAKNDRK